MMLNRIRRVSLPIVLLSIPVVFGIGVFRYVTTQTVPTILVIVLIVLVIVLSRLLLWARAQKQAQPETPSPQVQRR